MKIAILYDSRYGNTEQLAEFLGEKAKDGGHEVQLFRTKKTKPANLLAFQPVAILVGGPTHFGQPARTLRKYIEKLGKLRQASTMQKAAVFNCYTGDDVSITIQNQIFTALPKIEILEKTLPIRTGDGTGENWNKVMLQNNWKEEASSFTLAFLSFLS